MRRNSSDGAHHNYVSTKQTVAQSARQRSVGHEKYNAAPHARAPTKSEVKAAQAQARGAALPLRTVALTALVACLFVASCIYWIVVGLMPPAAAPTK